MDSETGLAKNDSVRTSSGFFYELGEDEVWPKSDVYSASHCAYGIHGNAVAD